MYSLISSVIHSRYVLGTNYILPAVVESIAIAKKQEKTPDILEYIYSEKIKILLFLLIFLKDYTQCSINNAV